MPRGNHPADVSPGEIVVYTAISAGYDRLAELPTTLGEGIERVAFVDRPTRARTWRSRPIHDEFADPCRNAKIHKLLPHRYFPDKRYSLWIDGSVRVELPFPLVELVRTYLADCDLVVFAHNRRTCVYQEAAACIHRRRDEAAVLREQVHRYTREGYPPNAGLAECSVILRRHSDAVRRFDEAWWREVESGSRRDQVSFPYVAWRTGIEYRTFPGLLPAANPLFLRRLHAREARTRPGRRIARAFAGAFASIGDAVHAATLRVAGGARDSLDDHSHDATEISLAGAIDDVEPWSLPVVDAGDGFSTSRRPRRVVAIGPERERPSWDWVGYDTTRELARFCETAVFGASSEIPACDVVVVVKQRPRSSVLAEARRRGAKLLFCPIDRYQSRGEIDAEAAFLRSCDLVLVHCERLLPLIGRYAPRTCFVEHHTRYALPTLASYKEHGFILWIGSCDNLPYLMRWLAEHPIEGDVKILTNLEDGWARRAARRRAAALGLSLKLSYASTSVAGCDVLRWSERLQAEMMRECKAALDTKWTALFNQQHKPPTKAQQFVASGIPFAVNAESYSAEYFRRRGFDVTSPLDSKRWLSREYFDATQRAALRLRERTSLEAVGAVYRRLIEGLLDPSG